MSTTKWVVLGCIGIFFVFSAIATIGGVILWKFPEVRNLFSGSKQPAEHNENPESAQPAQAPGDQRRPQRHAQKQDQKPNQVDDYEDDEEFDDSGEYDKEQNGKIYDGFDDFNAKPAQPQNRSLRTVESHGIQTVPKSFGGCTGFAPNHWAVDGAENNVAVGIDFRDDRQTEGGTYMIVAVAVYIDAYGNDFYGNATPERYIQTTLTALGVSGFQYISQPVRVNGGYSLVFWQGVGKGQQVRGFAHYTTFPTSNPSTYIIALRYGFTLANRWSKRMNVVYDIAASARCQKRLFPVRNQGYSSGSSSASKEPEGSSKDLSTLREETTMEFQNVYSPSTGEHWEASYDDYNPTGPEGPGYYRQVGNSYEKLEEGFPPQ